MGNYRQHLTFASAVGIVYAWLTNVVAGLHWIFGSVAVLLATISGLLPDLDHPLGVELKGVTGVLAVLISLTVWDRLEKGVPDLPFELHLWASVLTYLFIRHGMRRILSRLMVHRGISHSIPTCLAWGMATYLYYPSPYPVVRIMMGTAVLLGFFSHLVLDEICSVDLHGIRIKHSFGTALKFWARSPWATLTMYALLSYLSWRVIQDWPHHTLREILEQPVPVRKIQAFP